MGGALSWMNKSLAPLGERAVISLLIEAFGEESRFVIGLGHRGEQVRGYLELAHPRTAFEFVDVDPWSGAGSGPGRSLLCCREAIGADTPFYFAPCDAVLDPGVDLSAPGDWVGVAPVSEEQSERYCNFELSGSSVVGIADKRRVSPERHRAFTGVMRIESSEHFWEGLRGSDTIGGEVQVSAGLHELVRRDRLSARPLAWTDIGDEPAYRRELARRTGFDFSKPGESLYILNGRVIKMFEDERSATGRVERAARVRGVFPPMIEAPGGFVAYEFVEGQTLYQCVDHASLGRLLQWASSNLWIPVEVDRDAFVRACAGFYRVKTLDRVSMLEEIGSLEGEPASVNGRAVGGVRALLEMIDWERLSSGGDPVVFHGDLQFDNVLLRTDGSFTLLDWRQDFAGWTHAGDLDYDLAKMIGGIRMNYARIKHGELAHSVEADNAQYHVPSCDHAPELERDVLAFAGGLGRDPHRILLLVALIHLNMAPLHAEPFRSLLRDASRVELARALGALAGEKAA